MTRFGISILLFFAFAALINGQENIPKVLMLPKEPLGYAIVSELVVSEMKGGAQKSLRYINVGNNEIKDYPDFKYEKPLTWPTL